ncbi:MAG: Eco47II family restriction endonuclease [Gammaproteobacteria bacterium]|nr:Eco47II family restriction endonuclease [Gammaproteobacteria bacterium]
MNKREYGLSFISDDDFYNHTKATVEKYRSQIEIDLKKFNKNLIDPVKLTFDSKVYGKDIQSVVKSEIIRQIDKSNTNHIGYFHQNIFHYIGVDWRVPSKGYDVENLADHKYVEMKNKHNTMNSSSSQKTYMRMQHTLLSNPSAECMLVEVIAKKSQNIAWSMRLDGNPVVDNRIKRVSIDKFYELVTGEKDAFKNLCEQLPIVIADIVNDTNLDAKSNASNTVFSELKRLSPNLLKSLYLLSFEKYEGFDDFNA